MNAAKTNHISLSFDAISENEAFARMTAAMFMAQLNPTLDDVEDVKTAVSEAVTNAIIHGYEMGRAPSLQEYTQVIRHGGMIPGTRGHFTRITMSIRLG